MNARARVRLGRAGRQVKVDYRQAGTGLGQAEAGARQEQARQEPMLFQETAIVGQLRGEIKQTA